MLWISATWTQHNDNFTRRRSKSTVGCALHSSWKTIWNRICNIHKNRSQCNRRNQSILWGILFATILSFNVFRWIENNWFFLVCIMEIYLFWNFYTGAVRTNGFQTLLNYPDGFKFDLILHDFSVGSCFLPFLHKFNYPPMIAVTAFGHPPFLIDLIGSHHYYSYVPHFLLPFNDKMTFSQRFLNFLVHIEEYLYVNVKLKQLFPNKWSNDDKHVSFQFSTGCSNTI